jgi:hypothetical protein
MNMETDSSWLEYEHPDYDAQETRWQTCRDIIDGEDTVKAKNSSYLPIPTGMNTTEYTAYRDRAAFVAFAARSKEAMRGLVFRKRPLLVAPKEVVELTPDVTTTGLSLDQLASFAFSEILEVGRGGFLVEYPTNDESAPTLQDVSDSGMRPYLAFYKAEDILDWREGRVNNKKALTYVKLREVYTEASSSNKYTSDEVRRIRILKLDEEGYCSFEVWESRVTFSDAYYPVSNSTAIYTRIWPSADERVYQNGEPIRYIPFVPLGPLENSVRMQKPPLMDMVWINIHHYQASADRNHAIHYADCPTPMFFGQLLSADGSEVHTVKLGPTSAINIESGGDAKFLEMQGNGIAPTRELMEEYVMQMSVLGNKILATDARAAEAAETAAIHRAGEQAILATMANTLSEGITQALKMMAKWLGTDEDEHIYYHLSTDYLPNPMDSQTLIALIGAVTAGKMSDEEFYEALVAGELVRADKTYEQHQVEIQAMPPVVAPLRADSGNLFGQPQKGIESARNPQGILTDKDARDTQDSGTS